MMFCVKCQTDIDQCTCKDCEQKLDETDLAYKACTVCGKHYERCRCAEPNFSVRLRGKWREDIAEKIQLDRRNK